MNVSINNVFFILSVMVFMVVLTKASPITTFFTSEKISVQATLLKGIEPKTVPSTEKESRALHDCFKLLIRDFAGHMQYHCMHQPFLPRCAIYVCVFSWKRAQISSLPHARGQLSPTDGYDECLHEILFWLKNISMHRIHPNFTTHGVKLDDQLEEQDIKNVMLVGTHKNSCDLKPEEMGLILDYFKESIKENSDVYNSLKLCVDDIGAISVENSDQPGEDDDDGIGKLKHYLVECSKDVIHCAFPKELPVYYWCWLKEKRYQCVAEHRPPYERLSESQHSHYNLQYTEVYQPHILNNMLDQFSCIGEIFLVPIDGKDDFYIFFDVQFIIDFMKDLINIDDSKVSHRENFKHWTSLKEEGHSKLTLLKEHVLKFLHDHQMEPRYSHVNLELHPLIQSLLHLDFMFILHDEFYLPQFLPEMNSSSAEYHFTEVSQLEWEYVFDFGSFEFHHEFVYFRLLSRCAKSSLCSHKAIHSNCAAFSVNLSQSSRPETEEDTCNMDWFTLICHKACPIRDYNTYHNRIIVRASANMDKDSSVSVLKLFKGKSVFFSIFRRNIQFTELKNMEWN